MNIVYSDFVIIENRMVLQQQGEAEFMSWGVHYEELDHGVGAYSTAIIKLGDGRIKNIPVENVRFI